ncbi:MAG: cupredoxin domain-containing protein [bacterium]|nr:cupredoxin domain-containing protein [bacterium]
MLKKRVLFLVIILAVSACGRDLKNNSFEEDSASLSQDKSKKPFYSGLKENREAVLEQAQKNLNEQKENNIYPGDWPVDATSDKSSANIEPSEDTLQIRNFLVSAGNYELDPPEIRAKLGEAVGITFKSINGSHSFVIEELSVKSKTIDAGESVSVNFIASKTGSFEFYCGVGNHRELGMVGTLVIE